MEAAQSLCLGALVLLIVVVRRWMLYPGGWDPMFSAEYEKRRGALHYRRRRLREAHQAGERRRRVAAQRVARAERDYRSSVASAEGQLRRLHSEGPGDRLTGLGRITLYERTVRLSAADGELDADTGSHAPADGPFEDFPLEGLEVERGTYSSTGDMYLTLRWKTAKTVRVGYPGADYSERDVHRLELELEDAARGARKAREQRARSIAAAEERLAEARADTEAIEEARANSARVEAEEAENTDVSRAHEELEAERDTWESVTGRRPLL
ncbi:hypothetical protein E0L36_23260 [Streptomyces sp. AJS327]|uniref:hypothetical protein n=1 Tax=Streptomyces sp. AJS327 TaxID=2545265 RepID=UPI0015DF5DBB|nr:hypothetical protein [Streptomyces sp. AJS327]MBA0053677.1 hypothetical protein [Streptomyces sp. AJS327]